jgi:hypothetical protein
VDAENLHVHPLFVALELSGAAVGLQVGVDGSGGCCCAPRPNTDSRPPQQRNGKFTPHMQYIAARQHIQNNPVRSEKPYPSSWCAAVRLCHRHCIGVCQDNGDTWPCRSWDADSLDGPHIRLSAIPNWSVTSHLVRDIAPSCGVVSHRANSFGQGFPQSW